MTSIFDWSLDAASNATADASINWQEGQPPSTVNNSARVMMQRVKELLNDWSGIPAATGTANDLTLTLASQISAYAAGQRVTFTATATNTNIMTMNVNAVGGKPIRKFTQSGEKAVDAGNVVAGNIYEAVYVPALNSAAGAWLLLNPTQPTTVPVGTIITMASRTVPAGFLPLVGGVYSRADYSDLWAHAQVSNNMSASDVIWQSNSQWGRYSPGDGSTNFRVPDTRGMFIRGFDAGKGVDVGRLVGLHQDSQNIAHLHDVNDPLHTHLWGNGAQGFGLTPGNWGAYSQGGSGNLSTTASATGISIQSSGGSEARPRNIALLMYLKY